MYLIYVSVNLLFRGCCPNLHIVLYQQIVQRSQNFCIFFFEHCSHHRLFHTMLRKIHRKAFHLININNAWRHLSYRINAWCATAMAFTLYHLVDIDVTTTVNFRFVLPFGEVLTRKWRQQDSKANWFRINFQITC